MGEMAVCDNGVWKTGKVIDNILQKAVSRESLGFHSMP